jgi:ABC-type polysaccharide/polyol phosphate transport system ATPase subunit
MAVGPPLLEVAGLSKAYRIRRDADARRADPRWSGATTFRALDDVTFALARGEALALVGGNGAGKTTLLRVLSGVTLPSTGRAVLRGRLAGLLEAEAGFHPELTGRENLSLAAALRGFSRRELGDALEPLVAFAGVEGFLDQPVKRWSVGMRLRLAVALLLHLPADLLLLDEGLALADQSFRAAAVERVRALVRSGRGLLLVSHDADLLRLTCTRGLWLEAGRERALGALDDVLAAYGARS